MQADLHSLAPGTVLGAAHPAEQADPAKASSRRWRGPNTEGFGQRAEGVVFALYLAALAWVPFYFGSNLMPAWATNAMVFSALLAMLVGVRLFAGSTQRIRLRSVLLPVMLMTAVLAWIGVQMSTAVPSPLQDPVWALAAEALGPDGVVTGSISVNRDLTGIAGLRLLTCLAAFWLALQLCADPARGLVLVKAVALIGVGYAVFGLASAVWAPDRVLWAEKVARGAVTATFINRNNYATYAGIGLVAMVALLLRSYQQTAAVNRGVARLQWADVIDATGGRGAVLILGVLVILVALLLSQSRGGVLASFFGLFVFAVLRANPGGRRKGRALSPLLITGATLAMGLVMASELVLGRLADAGVSDVNRWRVYVITVRSIFANPVLGYGYGTFPDVFPIYRDGTIDILGIWDKAHDTYLEIIQGLGAVAALVMLAAIGRLVWICMEAGGRRQAFATVPAVAAGAVMLAAVHALVDFSLQMQAVAITLSALLGAGVAQAVQAGATAPSPARVVAPRDVVRGRE